MKLPIVVASYHVSLIWLCMIVCIQSLSPTQKNYSVSDGNTTCVVMTTAIQLAIPYTGKQNQSLTANVNLIGEVNTDGTCSNNIGKNTLDILFYNDTWSLGIVFENTSESNYYWSKTMLVYVVDESYFPNVSPLLVNKTIHVETILPNTTMKAPISGSYECTGSSVIQLNNSITLTLLDLHYRAFGTDNSTGFTTNNVQRCTADIKIPKTSVGVTVSVGIAIAVLIVVVLVVYLIADKLLAQRKLSYD